MNGNSHEKHIKISITSCKTTQVAADAATLLCCLHSVLLIFMCFEIRSINVDCIFDGGGAGGGGGGGAGGAGGALT